MLKVFPIDFVRQIFEQTLLEEHIKNKELFGGKNQVSILSFYEQLKSQDEVDRFVETYRELTDQQNRGSIILNGVVLSPENPSITNLYSCMIIPMSWTCSLRCNVKDRDQAIVTINNLIEKLKGKKVDVAQLNCVDENGRKYYLPFKVGTIGQNKNDPQLKDGDFVKENNASSIRRLVFTDLYNKGVKMPEEDDVYLYYGNTENKLSVCKATATNRTNILNEIDGLFDDGNQETMSLGFTILEGYSVNEIHSAFLKVKYYDDQNNPHQISFTLREFEEDTDNNEIWSVVRVDCSSWSNWEIDELKVYSKVPTSSTYTVTTVVDDNSTDRIVFPPEHNSFEKYKMSFSFDAIRCDEPRNLNANEYCELTFSGSATLVNNSVQLGNDLLKISMKKLRIDAQTTINFTNAHTYFLEPLEMPSGSNANTQINQIVSNKFLANSHTDSLALTLQYTFILDKEIDLLSQLFEYARYGTQGLTESDISPNMVFEVDEHWSSWGEYDKKSIETKIVENIDIENTESDTLTIGMTMQIQKAV